MAPAAPGHDPADPPDPPDPPDLGRLADPGPRPSFVDVVASLAAALGLSVRAALGGLVLIVVLAAAAWWWWHDPPSTAAESSIPLAPAVTEAGPHATATTVDEVVAHAAGAVARPGLYTLAPGSRVADLIEAAGGAAGEADLDRVNLAAPLGDGAQVHVPLLGEPSAAAPVGGAGATEGQAVPVDLNTAGPDELETLPGVGPATSAAIVTHREEHGPFVSVDDLISVRGIGDAKMAALRDLVTV